MKYSLKAKAQQPEPASVGHDDDQHETVLFGEDLAALKDISDLPDGQPEGSTESLNAGIEPKNGFTASQGNCEERVLPPCVSRVIDVNGSARISIVLGPVERSKWLGQVIGLIDSASEKDVVDITICANYSGVCDTCSYRSLLSSINRCKASVITHAGILTTVNDVVLWLSGDVLKWSKSMTCIFMRQQCVGNMGDIADFDQSARDAIDSFKEYSQYIEARGLFTSEELKTMYETRGLLCLFGNELEARLANLKPVE